MTDKMRLYWIDLAKGISILIVVMAHCYSLYPVLGGSALVVVGSLHNPVFYFCSGVLLARNEEAYKAQGKGFAVKKFFDLLVPFFLWTALYAGIGVCLLHRSILSAVVNAVNQLWFLPVLFFATCITAMLFMINKNYISFAGRVFFSCMTVAAFFSSMVAKVFAYTVIVLAGYWIQKNIAKVKIIFLPAAVFWCLFTLAAVMASYVT